MMWFYNMKIRARLLAGFILVALMAVLVGSIGVYNLNNIKKIDILMYNDMTQPIGKLGTSIDRFHKMRIVIYEAIMSTNNYNHKIEYAKIDLLKAEINKVNEEIKYSFSTPTQIAEFNEYIDRLKILYTELPSLLQIIDNGDRTTAAKMLLDDQPVGKAFSDVQETLGKLSYSKVDLAETQSQTIGATTSSAITKMIIMTITCLIIAILLGYIISNSISKPIKKLAIAANKLAVGEINIVVKSTTNDEIGKLNQSFSNMIDNIREQALNAQKIAEGNLDFEIKAKSKDDVLAISIKQVVNTLKILVSDTNMLATAAVKGNLAIRADATQHKGEYRKIIEGVNQTLDSIIVPLNVAANYVENISKGTIPQKITDVYNGDFNIIINNINMCIDAVNNMVDDANMLSISAVEGILETRADVTKHNGDFKKIIEGVNQTLDAVIKPIQEAAVVLDEMAKGNLQVSVEGEYKGDNAKIKNSLNGTIYALSSYISEISSVLAEMSNGNLVVEITNEYKGDFVEIKDSLNNIVNSFNDVLSDIYETALQVATESRQVSASAQALSQGSTEQASAVEELTGSMEEIATQTNQNALNASLANKHVISAKDAAVKGNEQMLNMVSAMDDINESSNNIAKIIKTIDEIAFQTNILALNAAVEAARAGQNGRGFAVVAQEVRNLAARSANAAKETAELIEGSIKKVSGGSKIANETAIALDKIVEGVTKVAILVGDIAISSNEQASGVTQINKRIMQVSDATQTNSASAEESAAASEELSGQSDILKEMIGKFELKSRNESNDKLDQINSEVIFEIDCINQNSKY